MTDVQRVWPRQALVAERQEAREDRGHIWYEGWKTYLPDDKRFFTDAEFAAHFVPADRLERLLAAVAWIVLCHDEARKQSMAAISTAPPLPSSCPCDLCAAWRAYLATPDANA